MDSEFNSFVLKLNRFFCYLNYWNDCIVIYLCQVEKRIVMSVWIQLSLTICWDNASIVKSPGHAQSTVSQCMTLSKHSKPIYIMKGESRNSYIGMHSSVLPHPLIQLMKENQNKGIF